MRALAAALALLATPAGAHCAADGVTWLAGEDEDGVLWALCGAAEPGAGDAWLQLRVGREGGPLTVSPAEKEGSMAAFGLGLYTRPGVTMRRLEMPWAGGAISFFERWDAEGGAPPYDLGLIGPGVPEGSLSPREADAKAIELQDHVREVDPFAE